MFWFEALVHILKNVNKSRNDVNKKKERKKIRHGEENRILYDFSRVTKILLLPYIMMWYYNRVASLSDAARRRDTTVSSSGVVSAFPIERSLISGSRGGHLGLRF